ncbi:MAG TPA: HAD family hydrolase [Clostridia bacterium]
MNIKDTKTKCQAVLLDVDGTILIREEERNSILKDKLTSLKKSGIVVALITARPYSFCQSIINWLNISDPSIYNSGSYIADQEKDYFDLNIDMSKYPELSSALKSIENDCREGFPSGRFFYSNNLYFQEIRNYMTNLNGFILGGWENKRVQGCWLRDLSEKHYQMIMELTNNFYVTHENVKNLHNIYIKPLGSTKSMAIKEWSTIMKVDLNNVVMFADGKEDIEPGKLVGILGSPFNAIDKIKEISSITSLLNSSDGVVDLLDRLF